MFKKGPKKDPKSCKIRSWAPLGFPLDPSCPTPETRMDKMTKKGPKTDFVTPLLEAQMGLKNQPNWSKIANRPSQTGVKRGAPKILPKMIQKVMKK